MGEVDEMRVRQGAIILFGERILSGEGIFFFLETMACSFPKLT
jgi:hypothetical protein